MPLTPADVHSISFKKAPIGNRGYNEDEVDNFLDEVERELERLIEVNTKLRNQLEAGGAVGGLGENNAELLAEFDRLQREKAAAEQAAMAAEAELEEVRQSAGGAEGGEQQALRLLMVAQRTADDHLDSARTEADTVLTEARNQADDMVTQARDKAETLERETQQRHQDVMSKLESKRAALHKHIEELKTFERQYRTRLKAYLDSQLRELTGRGAGVIEVESDGPAEVRGSQGAELPSGNTPANGFNVPTQAEAVR